MHSYAMVCRSLLAFLRAKKIDEVRRETVILGESKRERERQRERERESTKECKKDSVNERMYYMYARWEESVYVCVHAHV